MTPPASKESPDRVLVTAGLLVSSMMMFVCACFLLWFSYLRETHSFWLNSGGFPVFPRNFVPVSYYPLLAISVVGVVGLTIAALLGSPDAARICLLRGTRHHRLLATAHRLGDRFVHKQF